MKGTYEINFFSITDDVYILESIWIVKIVFGFIVLIYKANCDKITTLPFNYYLTSNLFANHHIIVNRAILCVFINIKMVLDHTQTMNLRQLIVTLKRK
jgi:hypothetical protein